MSYDIIVRFPSKKMAEEFCGQMSDGFGEGFCNFSHHRQKKGTDGTKNSHYKKITSSAPDGTPVYFVDSIEEFQVRVYEGQSMFVFGIEVLNGDI